MNCLSSGFSLSFALLYSSGVEYSFFLCFTHAVIKAHGTDVSIGGLFGEWRNLFTGEKLHWL